MDKSIGIFALFAVIQLCTCNDEIVPVELEIHPPGQIKQGDTVRIVCKITDPGLIDVNRITRVLGGQHHEIKKNHDLKPPFNTISRYSTEVTPNILAESVVVITNIQGSDSGTIACGKVPGGGGPIQEAEETLHVKVPPSRVALKYGEDEIASGDTVVINEGDEGDYSCEVGVDMDSNGPSHVSVTLGDKDITGKMSAEETPVYANANGLSDNKYSAVYSKGANSPNIVDKMYQGKTLTCTAHTAPFDALSTSFNIEYHYKATTDKCQRKQHYKIGDSMSITCTSSMYPAFSEATWMWAGEELGMEVGSESSTEDGRYKAQVEENKETGEFTFTLILNQAMEQDNLSRNTYELSIKNEAGDANFHIRVESASESEDTPAPTQGPEPHVTDDPGNPDTGNTSSAASFSTSLVFIFALLRLLLC